METSMTESSGGVSDESDFQASSPGGDASSTRGISPSQTSDSIFRYVRLFIACIFVPSRSVTSFSLCSQWFIPEEDNIYLPFFQRNSGWNLNSFQATCLHLWTDLVRKWKIRSEHFRLSFLLRIMPCPHLLVVSSLMTPRDSTHTSRDLNRQNTSTCQFIFYVFFISCLGMFIRVKLKSLREGPTPIFSTVEIRCEKYNFSCYQIQFH